MATKYFCVKFAGYPEVYVQEDWTAKEGMYDLLLHVAWGECASMMPKRQALIRKLIKALGDREYSIAPWFETIHLQCKVEGNSLQEALAAAFSMDFEIEPGFDPVASYRDESTRLRRHYVR